MAMSDKGWICIGTLEGQTLYFNPGEQKYAVDEGQRLRELTSEELIQKSKKRRSAMQQSARS